MTSLQIRERAKIGVLLIGWICAAQWAALPALAANIDPLADGSQYAWAENAGWINFAPTGGGVTINACGEFHGRAWGENVGCITFSSTGANAYQVTTAWNSLVDGVAPVTVLSTAPCSHPKDLSRRPPSDGRTPNRVVSRSQSPCDAERRLSVKRSNSLEFGTVIGLDSQIWRVGL